MVVADIRLVRDREKITLARIVQAGVVPIDTAAVCSLEASRWTVVRCARRRLYADGAHHRRIDRQAYGAMPICI